MKLTTTHIRSTLIAFTLLLGLLVSSMKSTGLSSMRHQPVFAVVGAEKG